MATRSRMARRRDFLRTLGAGLAVSGASALLPRISQASDLSLADRIDLLYGNKFSFDAQGLPQVGIGLMDGQDEVVLESKGGVTALPSGDGGTAIRGGSRWRIRLDRGRPSQQRFSVAVQSIAATDLRAVDKAASAWRKRGIEVEEREVGTLFGVKGRALDTRQILLTTGDFADETDAEREARALSQRHGALGRLHPRIQERATGRLIAEDLETGIEVRAEGVLWFSPAHAKHMTVKNVLSGVTIGPTRREDRTYRGQIYVAIDRSGKLSVVNLVNELDLLAGLVPAEIFASSSSAALEAQAIAARGQLITKIGTRHLDDPYLLCAHQHCQVYAGSSREHPRTTAAVHKTRGRLLMRPNGSQLVDTVYSANSGGHTEDNDLVWPSPIDAQLRGRADPMVPDTFVEGITENNLGAWLTQSPRAFSLPKNERLRDSYRWTAQVDPSEILGRGGVPRELGEVRSIQVIKRGRSGRAIQLRVMGSHGEHDVHGELTIRRALGDLRSSMFIVETTRDRFGRFVLHGGGHGHGVGMCQHGAMGMAEAGKSHGDILRHYYRGGQLVTLW